ncbi:hypothetical protein CTA2_1818 [Colletotrichum tanaceti]|uniref:Uncharacterized protein n=1 Tax=Colletotrichum tanaceti TaxID=1306861 RepID=A0A4U6X730_9PEZI|nr:hypothetical protein CTA2_1818 [Colletotrichum tanaceti]TKW51291.1 hypothetical protein CTA1_9530 [Colletotrichum tanaceti]
MGAFGMPGQGSSLWPGFVECDDTCLETSSATQRADDTMDSDASRARGKPRDATKCRVASAPMPTRVGSKSRNCVM